MRALPRPALVEGIRRQAEKLMDAGGIIRSVESLGERQLPQRQKAHDELHSRGVYFNIHCDMPNNSLSPLLEEFRRDTDILRKTFVALDNDWPEPKCTLEEEMLPPAYRPSIQKMIEEGRKPHRFKDHHTWKPKTGLDYYPFHR